MVAVLNDVVMPNRVLLLGVRGKQMRQNSRVTNQGGFVDAEIIWSKTLRQYEIGIVPMRAGDWQGIEGLHEVTEGGAYGFLMEDPKDCLTNGSGLLLPGTTQGAFRTFKRYTSAGSTRYKDRLITRPMASIQVFRNGVPVVPGAAPGNAALDPDTGTLMFVADESRAVSSITPGASTVINFASAFSAVPMGGRIWISGVTGADAAILNGKFHTVTAAAGTAYTLSTNTAGKTVSGGTGYQYPQPNEALTWVGGFYVPVHFEADSIDWQLVAGGHADVRFLSGPSVMLVEVREA